MNRHPPLAHPAAFRVETATFGEIRTGKSAALYEHRHEQRLPVDCAPLVVAPSPDPFAHLFRDTSTMHRSQFPSYLRRPE